MKPDKVLKELKKWLKEVIKEDKFFRKQSLKLKDYALVSEWEHYLLADGLILDKIKELEDEL